VVDGVLAERNPETVRKSAFGALDLFWFIKPSFPFAGTTAFYFAHFDACRVKGGAKKNC
jgi:hypothetical protein